jgi:hypothetical protein
VGVGSLSSCVNLGGTILKIVELNLPENSLQNQVDRLLGDFSKLAPRIKHINVNSGASGEQICVRCSYIAFRDGAPTFDDFINTVAEHLIPFCIPRNEIKKAQVEISKGDFVSAGRIMVQLTERAKNLFIRAKKGCNRSGEAGEIVLYLLTEWLLRAPQIVSKMYLKTNSQMPVYGTDGIHARFDDAAGKLIIYWGESKAHAGLDSALGSALKSISDFIKNGHEAREIGIVEKHSEFNDLGVDAKDAILRYLDPYAEESNSRSIVYSCLLLFDFKGDTPVSKDSAENDFVSQVVVEVNKFVNSIRGVVEGKGLSLQNFEFFLLPVPSVQDFRDKFQEKIGWPV